LNYRTCPVFGGHYRATTEVVLISIVLPAKNYHNREDFWDTEFRQ